MVERLRIQSPDPELVNSYLKEIAGIFGVKYEPPLQFPLTEAANETFDRLHPARVSQVFATIVTFSHFSLSRVHLC